MKSILSKYPKTNIGLVMLIYSFLPFSMGTERNISFEANYRISRRKHLAIESEKYNVVSIVSIVSQ